MRKATQFLLMAVVVCVLTAWSVGQTQQKKQGSATQDSTAAGTQSDDATQSSGGTDTGGTETAKKKKPTGTVSGGSTSSGGDNPSESVTAKPTSGGTATKRKSGQVDAADFRTGGEENPKETVEYKDPEDMTTRGVTKPPPPPPSGPGGADDKKVKNPGDYNLSTKFSVEISGKQGTGSTGTGSPDTGEAGLTTRKAGKDQNGVANGEGTSTDSARPGHSKPVKIDPHTGGTTTYDESPKETVTSGATKSTDNTLCGTTNHLRTCKPGETPVNGTTVVTNSNGRSEDPSMQRKKSTSSTKDDSAVAPDDDSTGAASGGGKTSTTETTKKPK